MKCNTKTTNKTAPASLGRKVGASVCETLCGLVQHAEVVKGGHGPTVGFVHVQDIALQTVRIGVLPSFESVLFLPYYFSPATLDFL